MAVRLARSADAHADRRPESPPRQFSRGPPPNRRNRSHSRPSHCQREEMREAMARAGGGIADRQDLDIGAIGKTDQFLRSRRGFLAEIVALGDEETCSGEFLCDRVELPRIGHEKDRVIVPSAALLPRSCKAIEPEAAAHPQPAHRRSRDPRLIALPPGRGRSRGRKGPSRHRAPEPARPR